MRHLLSLGLLVAAPALAAAQLGTPIPVGPFGGQCLTVDVDPANPAILLLGSYEDGLLRSTNGGLTFAPVPQVDLPLGGGNYLRRLERDPNQPNRLIALVGNSIYTSTNGGDSWTNRNVGASGSVRWVAIQPGGSVWLAGTSSEVLRSPDDGFTWTQTFTGQTLGQLAFAPSQPTRVYLATFNGLRVSNDAGLTFVPAGPDTTWLKGVAVAPNDANVVFGGGLQGRIKKSINGGLSWNDTLLGGFSSVEFFEWDMSATPARLWACRLESLFATQDLGNTWPGANTGLPASQPIVQDIAFGAAGAHFLATEDGFFRAPAAHAPWTMIGLPNVEMFDVAVVPGGKRVAVNYRGAYVSPGPLQPFGPSAWVFDFGAHTNTLVIDPDDDDRWILGGVGAFIDNATVRIATNNGANISTPLEIFGAGQVRALALDPHGEQLMIAGLYPAGFGQAGLARSTNRGATWTPVAGSAGWGTTAVAWDPSVPGRALALQGLTGQIRVSTDFGVSWSPIAGWGATGTPWLLAADPHRPNVFYGGDEGSGLHVSANGGVTWAPIPGVTIHSRSRIAFHSSVPRHFWISDAQGRVLVTTNGGASFAVAHQTAGGANGIALDHATGSLLVATATTSVVELFGASPYVDLGGASVGSGGFVPRHLATGPLAKVGNAAWGIGCDRLLGGTAVLAHIGLSNPQLPFAGGIVGSFLPTIASPLLVASGIVDLPGAGTVTLPIPIPNMPGLAGIDLFTQFFALDPNAIGGIALSNALKVRMLP